MSGQDDGFVSLEDLPAYIDRLRARIAALEADKGEPDVFCCCENGDSFRVFAVRLKDTVRTLHICSRCGGVVRLTKEEVTP